ncbi:hypothetical protein [Arthrobacter sp. 162MFSha1.1]|uniref:hypothetical protein n=1 Tax=Arthrobacter sp. 162MFSha1.1 TaxID=1151119 RepID=UPI00036334A7|nr:hypothetical protein [Arthrobacter sp. 162MFSha1.1]
MSPTIPLQASCLNRKAFSDHFNAFWGSHEYPADAVLTVTYEKTIGKSAKASVHVPIDEAAVWKVVSKVGSDRKVWIGIAPRSMDRLLARIEEHKAWNAEHGDKVRAFNETNAEAISAGSVQRKKLKTTDLEWIRGTKTDCYPMPGFALDLDVNMESSEHNEHKLDKPADDGKEVKIFPSAEQAQKWVNECPIESTLEIWTGGGYHIWYRAAELMSLEEQEKALARFKAYWVGVKESSGMHIDVSTLETTRVMRPAGSLKGKGEDAVYYTPIETVYYDHEAAFTAEDIDTLPEYIDPRRERRVRNDDGTTTVRPISTRTQAEKDALPGTKLSHNLPVSVLLEDVLEFERNGDRFTAPWEGHYEQGAVHAALYTATDGAELVKVYGERTAVDLGLDGPSPCSSFGLLINYWCKGDVRLAARIARHFEDDADSLVELLQTGPTSEELAEQFPVPAADIEDPFSAATPYIDEADAQIDAIDDAAPGGAVEVGEEIQAEINEALAAVEIPAEPTAREAFAGEKNLKWTVPGTDNFFIQVGPGVTGLWESFWVEGKDDKKTQKFRRITDWVAWRSEAVAPRRLSTEGKSMPAADARYTVQLLNDHGLYEVAGLSAKESVDAAVVLDKLNSGSSLPVKIDHKKHMENTLRALGRHDAQRLLDQFTSTGILNDNGKHVYLAPAGSINAEGVTHAYTVGAPANSQEGALRPAQAAMGFDRVAEGAELVKAAKALKAYMAITPGRLDHGIATLGALIAAPLPMNRYTTCVVLAPPGSGKSITISGLQSFVSGVGVDGSSYSMTFSNKSTANGAALISGWHCNSLGVYDDFRISGNPEEDKRRASAFESVVQSSYGADGKAAGVAEGGLRASTTATTTSVITGEGAPASSGTAIHSRYVKVQMAAEDYAITPRNASPLDTFIDEYANTGLARAMYASYVQWIIRRIDALGSVAAFKEEVSKRKKSWESDTPGRSAETASVPAVAWMYLHDWAAENGISDALPSMEEVTKTLLAVVADNTATIAELSPGNLVLRRISEMIAGDAAYVESHTLEVPRGNERNLGWKWDDFREQWGYGNRMLGGYLSEDRRWIAVPTNAVNTFRKLAGLTDITSKQFQGMMADFVRPGTKPGDKPKSDMRIKKQINCYTFSVESLELDLVPADAEVAPAAAAVKPAAKPAPKPVTAPATAENTPDYDDDF